VSPPRVLFIVGSGYSGSTLLDLLVGGHSRARGYGELRSLDDFLGSDGLCTCRRRASECEFWRAVLARLGPDRFRLYPSDADVGIVVGQTVRLLRAIWDTANTSVLVDSSKWMERALLLHQAGGVDARVVHLVRDGRAVAWSHLRRGTSLRESVLTWRAQNERALDWLSDPGAPPSLRVRYEDLVAAPAETLREVCALAGLDYEPGMLRFRSGERHLVSGNPMRFQSGTAIQLDDEWRRRLGFDDLLQFEELAADLARRLGYDPEPGGASRSATPGVRSARER
jgi:hypothetical protein